MRRRLRAVLILLLLRLERLLIEAGRLRKGGLLWRVRTRRIATGIWVRIYRSTRCARLSLGLAVSTLTVLPRWILRAGSVVLWIILLDGRLLHRRRIVRRVVLVLLLTWIRWLSRRRGISILRVLNRAPVRILRLIRLLTVSILPTLLLPILIVVGLLRPRGRRGRAVGVALIVWVRHYSESAFWNAPLFQSRERTARQASLCPFDRDGNGADLTCRQSGA